MNKFKNSKVHFRSCHGKEVSLSIKFYPYLENSYKKYINKNPESPIFFSENFSKEDLEKTVQRCDSMYRAPEDFYSFWDVFK